MTLALTMMNHIPAPVTTSSTVMVKHVMTSTSVCLLMPVMPMLPVPTATVPIAAHVKMVTSVTVLLALIMINVHSEQTMAMSTHLVPITRVHFFVLVEGTGRQ